MDSPHLDETRHKGALEALRRINWVSRSAANLWQDMRRVAESRVARPLRVLDLACGGGDVALSLERRARWHGIDLHVRGCDASSTAVAMASERAAAVGSAAKFFRLDVLHDPLPDDVDVICSTLFLHHLDEPDAVRLLRTMAAKARRMIVVQDLERSRTGFVLAVAAVNLLTRSEVARVDGPISVRAAYTRVEAAQLARRAGLNVAVRRCWPRRWSLVWQPE